MGENCVEIGGFFGYYVIRCFMMLTGGVVAVSRSEFSGLRIFFDMKGQR